ncbi:MAG: STAS domain-containing protein [Actinomycetota bacterium]
MTIEIRTVEQPSTSTVHVSGELDLTSAPQLEAALIRAEQAPVGTIVLDLSGLEFMDSSGLRLVLSADKRARESGRELLIVPGPEQVRRVFQVTRVDKRLRFAPSAEQPSS